MKNENVYLSIVVTSRNDNHGGDLLARMQAFVDSLVFQCNKFSIKSELLIVEWNPLPDKESLSTALSWREDNKYCAVKVIEVPNSVHQELGNSDKIPLYQMIGKNVGIRRAKGDFVLVTNIDILLSDDLMWFLSKKQLSCGYIYRTARYDVENDWLASSQTAEEHLKHCMNSIIRIQGLHGVTDIDVLELGENEKVFSNMRKMPVNELTSLLEEKSKGRDLFTNACGDFVIMAREHWHEMKGYPELDRHDAYVDGLIMYMAEAHGLKQFLLREPMCVYHIEHKSSFKDSKGALRDVLSLDYENEYKPWCNQMRLEGRSINPNDNTWGHFDHKFSEHIVADFN